MVEEKPLAIAVTQFEIKTSGRPLSLKLLYVMLHEWMIEHEYAPDNKDANFPEEFYYERRSQQEGREMWAYWRNDHVPQNNPFYRRLLNIDIHTARSKQVELVHNGKKLKLDQGELWVSCYAFLEIDWKKQWRKHWLLKNFLTNFWQRIIWRDLEDGVLTPDEAETWQAELQVTSSYVDFMERYASEVWGLTEEEIRTNLSQC